jgi:potassium-transporting ATPase KdpC subunit
MIQNYLKSILNAFLLMLIMTIILGLIYPIIVMGIGQVCFPFQANGSLVEKDSKIIGSALIQQEFTKDKYFHGRPNKLSSIDTPTSDKMIKIITARIKKEQKINLYPNKPVPLDLITDSGSSLDPDISPKAAYYQVKRVSRARNIPRNELNLLIKDNIKSRSLGFLGQRTVNVLALNLALDKYKKN